MLPVCVRATAALAELHELSAISGNEKRPKGKAFAVLANQENCNQFTGRASAYFA